MFFRDLQQVCHATANIETMTFVAPPEHNKNAGYYQVTLKSGETCKISYETQQRFMRASWQHVPAYPGCTLLELKDEFVGNCSFAKSNDAFHRTAVLAWALDEEGATVPITGEGYSEIRNWAVLTPNGLVSDKFGGSFSSEDAYLASLDEDPVMTVLNHA